MTRAACFILTGLALLRTAVAESPAELAAQAEAAARAGDSAQAVALLTDLIAADPKNSPAYYRRGREHFRLGKIRESVADFDQHVELSPDQESKQWERGIALYYAGEFERGAKQFELYQTFHNQDVENSTWRYLCVARKQGVAKARETMLPIENDPRVPMMQIFDLYRGKLRPDDVLAAARAGEPPPEALAGQLFYAHLYLGLFHEAAGNAELAKKFISLAADEKLRTSLRINTYMWDVARVHAERLRNKKNEK